MGKTYQNRKIASLNGQFKTARKWAHLGNPEGKPQSIRREFNRAVRHAEKTHIENELEGDDD